MRVESDVRKILDELHSNRLSIDNDRKAYEKVRIGIQEVDGAISKSVEQWNTYCQKLTELTKSIFDRSSDVNFFNLKNEVLDKNSEKLEKSIQSCKHDLGLLRKQLAKISSRLLQSSVEFSKEWNSGKSGRVFRLNRQAEEISELNNNKKNLEYEMDNFLLMQRSVEYAEAEKQDIIKRLEKHKEEAEAKDSAIREKLEIAVRELSNLDKKREELKSTDVWTQEFMRISEGIETAKKSISFLENRVSETQRILEYQRLEAPCTDPMQRPKEQTKNHVYATSDEFEPPFKIRSLEHFTITPSPEADVTTNFSVPLNPPFQTSEYSFNEKTKAPRMFQFKKKSLPSSGNTEGVSNRVQKTDEANSGFQAASLILRNSNSERK